MVELRENNIENLIFTTSDEDENLCENIFTKLSLNTEEEQLFDTLNDEENPIETLSDEEVTTDFFSDQEERLDNLLKIDLLPYILDEEKKDNILEEFIQTTKSPKLEISVNEEIRINNLLVSEPENVTSKNFETEENLEKFTDNEQPESTDLTNDLEENAGIAKNMLVELALEPQDHINLLFNKNDITETAESLLDAIALNIEEKQKELLENKDETTSDILLTIKTTNNEKGIIEEDSTESLDSDGEKIDSLLFSVHKRQNLLQKKMAVLKANTESLKDQLKIEKEKWEREIEETVRLQREMKINQEQIGKSITHREDEVNKRINKYNDYLFLTNSTSNIQNEMKKRNYQKWLTQIAHECDKQLNKVQSNLSLLKPLKEMVSKWHEKNYDEIIVDVNTNLLVSKLANDEIEKLEKIDLTDFDKMDQYLEKVEESVI